MKVVIRRKQLVKWAFRKEELEQFDALADGKGKWKVDWTSETQYRLLKEGKLHHWIEIAAIREWIFLWNLDRRDLSGADLSKGRFSGWRMVRANLSGANLEGASFHRGLLFRANFSGANLAGANFSRATLIQADFSNADLTKASFDGAEMFKANFAGAKAHKAEFRHTDLPFANFAGADFSGADFKGANLYGVDLAPANLADADLSGAQRRHSEPPLPGWSETLSQSQLHVVLLPIGHSPMPRRVPET